MEREANFVTAPAAFFGQNGVAMSTPIPPSGSRARCRYRTLLFLFCILTLAFLAYVTWTHFRLPERVPVHFGPSGEPDRWSSRNELTWGMAGVGIFYLLLFGLGAFLFPKIPARLWNLPNRDYWLAPERRRATGDALNVYYLAIGIATVLLTCFVHWATVEVALGHRERLPFPWWVMGVYLAVVAAACVLLFRRFGKVPEEA